MITYMLTKKEELVIVTGLLQSNLNIDTHLINMNHMQKIYIYIYIAEVAMKS